MRFFIIAAVAALASANTVARCGDCEDYTPIKVDGKCVVVAEGPNDRKEYTLGLGDCKEAINFFYDAELKQLKSDVKDKCLSAIPVDGKKVPGLAACKDKAEKHWIVVEGDRWLNEKVCECLVVEKKDGCETLVFGECKKAPKCGMEALPKPVKPTCKATPTCGKMPACPATCSCESDKCVSNYQCSVNAHCAYGQVCQNGWCVYPKPTCSAQNPCPYPYVCDERCGQCYLPSKCPPGYEQEGYWCVPIKPECNWHHPCPSDYICMNGKCVFDGCKSDADCLPGFQCIDQECMIVDPVVQCKADSECANTEACEGGWCVYMDSCEACMDTCDHGVCPEPNQGRRAAGVMGWF